MISDLEGVDILPEHMVRLRLTRPSDLTLRALCEIPILPARAVASRRSKTCPAWARARRHGALSSIGLGTRQADQAGTQPTHGRAEQSQTGRNPIRDRHRFRPSADSPPQGRNRRSAARARHLLPGTSVASNPARYLGALLSDTSALLFRGAQHASRRAGESSFSPRLSLLWDRPRVASEFHHGLVRAIGAPTFGEVPPDVFDPPRPRACSTRRASRTPTGTASERSRRAGSADFSRARVLAHPEPGNPCVCNGSPARRHSPRHHQRRRRGGRLARAARGFRHGRANLGGSQGRGHAPSHGSAGRLSVHRLSLRTIHPARRPTAFRAVTAARAPVLQQLAELLASDRPALFLYRHDVPALVSKRVHGLAAVGDRLDLRSVWIDP